MKSSAGFAFRLAALLGSLVPLPASGGGFPILYTWPDSSPPCNGTLQAWLTAFPTTSPLPIEEGTLVADVVANRVEGSFFHDGIALLRYANGVLTARVLGNLVRGANAGGAGIVIEGNGAWMERTTCRS